MVVFFLLIVLTSAVGVYVGIPTALLSLLFFIVGATLARVSNHERGATLKIYSLSFALSLLYTFICFVYMKEHGYNRLLINDTDYFITTVESYLGGNSLKDVIEPIWDDYDVFVRSKAGYITFLAIFGHLSRLVGADLYFTLQLAHFAICSFGAVIIYNLLGYYIKDQKYRYSMAVIITLLPMYFSYSTYILRDNLIALGFYYIIWLLHKAPSPAIIVKFAITCGIITAFRTESGYASIMFFPMYLLINNTNRRKGIMGVAVMAVLAVVGTVVFRHMGELMTVFNDNYDAYFSETGSGTISFLSGIPIVGNVLAVIYGVIMPIPCWGRMSIIFSPHMPFPHLYNVMNFPSMLYAAFNTYIIVYLIRALFTKSYKGLEIRMLKIILIPTAAFLLLQSGIVEPRRLMGVFPVFFVLWAVLFKKMTPSYNHASFNLFLGIFIILQLVGSIRFL